VIYQRGEDADDPVAVACIGGTNQRENDSQEGAGAAKGKSQTSMISFFEKTTPDKN